MQAITHFLVGIIIQMYLIVIFTPINIAIGVVLVIILAFFSHFLVDSLARMTYHLRDPAPHDKFWVSYHIIIYAASAIVLIYFWKQYWWSMGTSVLIDVYDWGFIRGGRKLKKDPLWLKGYEIHPLIDRFRNKCFAWLPDWNERRVGVVPETILVILLLSIIYFRLYL
ncbi:MAG: hypothetical protein ACTSQI_10700 [Candidatus Helarchaeota archaeon]